MQINLIRHFQTQGNRVHQYVGRTDEPLAQCEENRKLLQRTYPQAQIIAASPMKRCVQTAEWIYGRAPDILCPQLREMDFGLFEGKTYEELKTNPSYQRWLESNGTLPFPEGEDVRDFIDRCKSGFEQLVNRLLQEQYTTVAVVVHGGTIMAILSEFSSPKSSFYDWQVKNGAGYRCRIDETTWKDGEQKLMEIQRL
ncbi:MAG: histidine phosphatase family protein [Hespellia sp.]|nr:histidine phosphatase family protein [Hespellia sp.]